LEKREEKRREEEKTSLSELVFIISLPNLKVSIELDVLLFVW